MWHRKDGGALTFICDECGTEFKTGEETFEEAWRIAEKKGWSGTKQDDGSYEDLCLVCADRADAV